jgi:ferritin-like metal-binding protein YciE
MSLHEVLIDELRDLYSAENQLVKALPKAIKGISNPEMKTIVREHLEQTKGQVLRLREVFQHLGKKPTGEHCSGMEGCIKEVTEALEKDEEGALKDAGILGASLRVEHYEIAGYTAAIALAKALKEKDIVALLTETLNEEKTAAKNVVSGAAPILKEALSQEDEEEDGEDEEEEQDPKQQEKARKSEEDEQEAQPEMANQKKR